MKIDKYCSTWLVVKTHCEQRIVVLLDQLMSQQVPVEKVPAIRAQLAEVRNILKLSEPDEQPIGESDE